MNWNTLFKFSNKEVREERQKEISILKLEILKDKDKLNSKIKKYQKLESPLYRLKDKFNKIYRYALTIFVLWLLPIIGIIFFLKGTMLMTVLLFVYGIVTFPIPLLSMLTPTIKFFVFDFPNRIDDVKVTISPQYVIAIMFSQYRTIIPLVKKIDANSMFSHKSGDYIVEKDASFLSSGKIMVLFYLEGIPNPLKFNFVKYLKEFTESKRKNPNITIKDWEGKDIDVAFSSENLREYKKYKMYSEFFRDYQGETNKVVFAILGFCALVVIALLFMYMLKK